MNHMENQEVLVGMLHVCGVATIIHPQSISCLSWQIYRNNEFLSFLVEKEDGSRNLVFWLLGTITGLKDRVRGLVA